MYSVWSILRGRLPVSRFRKALSKHLRDVLDVKVNRLEGDCMSDRPAAFLEALGYSEEPFGMFYTGEEPESGFVPKEGAAFSYEMEQRGEIDFSALFQNWSCVMGNIWLARKKSTAAYFEARRFGCIGGSFYLGFHKPQLEFIAHYVSTGIPDRVHGERYLPSPEVTRRFFATLEPRPAPARFCVFKPISLFRENETPEVVTFFARGEVMAGLCSLPHLSPRTSKRLPHPSEPGAAIWPHGPCTT